ncbi:MAG: PIN domain-containing protein [Solirubrobacteraceae bacterium]
MARVIIDTGVLVAGARGQLDGSALGDEDDVVLPAVVVAEYLAGVLLDHDAARQAAQRAFLADVLRVVPVSDYTQAVAEHHAELLAHVSRAGQPRGAHDLLIAATALATGRTLITTDAGARFDQLPGISSRLVATS